MIHLIYNLHKTTILSSNVVYLNYYNRYFNIGYNNTSNQNSNQIKSLINLNQDLK